VSGRPFLTRAAVLAGLTLLLRAPSLVRPIMDIDEGSYAAIACRLLGGGLPYRDGVENKAPGIYYIYEWVFALFGRYNMTALHLSVALTALLTALVCGAIARQLVAGAASRVGTGEDLGDGDGGCDGSDPAVAAGRRRAPIGWRRSATPSIRRPTTRR
jgi:hypothetical protein